MNGVRFIIGAVIGFLVGWVAGMILWIPTCFVAAIAKNDMHGGEAAANHLNILPFVCGAIGLVIGLIVDILKAQEASEGEKRRREAEEKARLAEEQRLLAEQAARRARHAAEQNSLRLQLTELGECSLSSFETLPTFLSRAEEHLDKANVDFKRHAFVPFWNSIEESARELGHFDEGVRQIATNSKRYRELLPRYEGNPPPFPIPRRSAEKLAVAKTTATRMATVVDTAHCDHDFASIYLQVKTNQILIAGFTNLAHALDRMSLQIAGSIRDLAGAVDGMAASLDDSVSDVYSKLSDISAQDRKHYAEIVEQGSAVAARQIKALEMLDNIQHRRRPI
jgi:hypothetical protein